MKKQVKVFFTIIIISFYSCISNNTLKLETNDTKIELRGGIKIPLAQKYQYNVDNKKIATIKIGLDKKIKAPYLSEVLKEFYCIPLETNDESIMGDIDKIIIKNQKIYILDSKKTKSLFVFDLRGKFLNKICRKGRGPGEYIQIKDFQVMENDEIIIYGAAPYKLMRFNKQGRFIKEKKIENIFARGFHVHNKNVILFTDGEISSINKSDLDYYLVTIDSTHQKIISRNFKMDSRKRLIDMHRSLDNLISCNGELYYIPTFEDTVYKIENNTFKALYYFDLPGIKMDDKFFKGREINRRSLSKEYWTNRDISKGIYKFRSNDLFISFHFIMDNLYWHAFYNKKTGNKILSPIYKDDLGLSIFKTETTMDEYFVAYIEAFQIYDNLKDADKLSSNLLSKYNWDLKAFCKKNNITETSNPVLVFYKLKEF